jgi:hypothetical protein
MMNIPSFVHIDDGLGFKRTKEEARSSSREGQGGFMSVGVSYLRCQVPVEELEFWVNRLEEFSGQLIRHSAEVLEYYVCSDSGEHQIGGRVCKKGTEQVHKRFQVSLEDLEKGCSSTYRELRSIESGLELIGREVRL